MNMIQAQSMLEPTENYDAESLRVVLVAENVSRKMSGESGQNFYYVELLRERKVNVWIVCHERVREELRAEFPDDKDFQKIHFIKGGLLVEPSSKEGFIDGAEAMIHLAQSPDLRRHMGEAGPNMRLPTTLTGTRSAIASLKSLKRRSYSGKTDEFESKNLEYFLLSD